MSTKSCFLACLINIFLHSGHLITGPIILQMDDSLLSKFVQICSVPLNGSVLLFEDPCKPSVSFVFQDDLQIYSIAQREVLLTESRRLCLQELELVDKALEYKQKLDELPKSDSDVNKRSPIKSSGDKLDKLPHKLSTKRTIDKNIKCNHTEGKSTKANLIPTASRDVDRKNVYCTLKLGPFTCNNLISAPSVF